MKASLVSREPIADSMELMARGYFFDAMITVVACDKTIPAGAMALLRVNRPGLLVYGGSVMPGRLGDRDLTIQDVYEAVGAHAAGEMTDEELKAIEDFACPGAGACGGQFTANTMAMAREADVPLQMDDFDRVSGRTPLLGDMRPGGRYAAADLDRAGGTRLVAQRLVQGGFADSNAMTVSGRTFGEEAALAQETPGQ